MQATISMRSFHFRTLVLVSGLLLGPMLSGCGKEDAPYPKAKVTTSVGRPGVCAHCNKKISKVEKKHLVTIDGVQYIVCDKKCAADLKKSLAEQ